ncbi:response regulator [Skermanella mucosa]|uniref:response regulator n=1 Tax=Skermanella mucosa TaxID=1789672 RepID=UPI00192BFA90|nr:response regulator [Skermanella mucosa]UEM23123.1 response regulator [Skermanella mucosa]
MLTDDAPILIVDDDNLVRLGIRMTLEDADFRNLQVAKSGSAAVRMALRHHPAVVLMDVRLGDGIDGVEAAQRICREHSCKVIFLTGSNETATQLRISATDAAGVLVKPILPQYLLEALEALPG